MAINKLLDCWNCGTRLDADITDEECFFWCNKDCKHEHAVKEKERRELMDRDHMPATRRVEVDKTNELIKYELSRAASTSTEVGPTGKPKGKRQCGVCGEYGHNARTCSQKNKTVSSSTVDEVLNKLAG